MRALRVAIGGFYHETHSLAIPKTGMKEFTLYRGAEILETYRGTRTELGGCIDAAGDLELVPLIYATTAPSGLIQREVYEVAASELVAGIHRTQPDALFLVLHGAMVVEGLIDAEGDLLERLRAVLGDKPLAVTVDFHGNISHRMVDRADLMIGYKTVPHVDPYDRARECCGLLGQMLRGQIRPVMSLKKPPVISTPPSQATDSKPMVELIGRALELEQDPRVLSASVFGGFAYSDEPRMGMSCLVVTNGDPVLADQLSGDLCNRVWAARADFAVPQMTPTEAVRWAMAAPYPVAIVDVADNIGGGTAADGTGILAALLAAGASGALVTIKDPEAVAQAFAVGVGGTLNARIGAKTDAYHGEPVPISAEILQLQTDGRWRYVGEYMTGQPGDMGRAALVRAGGVDIIITENRTPAWDRGYLFLLGIDPRSYRIFTPKAALAWKTAFGDLVEEFVFVDAPGITPVNLERLGFTNLSRPIYPLDQM
jgi:microcystin degradation protein MlrC